MVKRTTPSSHHLRGRRANDTLRRVSTERRRRRPKREGGPIPIEGRSSAPGLAPSPPSPGFPLPERDPKWHADSAVRNPLRRRVRGGFSPHFPFSTLRASASGHLQRAKGTTPRQPVNSTLSPTPANTQFPPSIASSTPRRPRMTTPRRRTTSIAAAIPAAVAITLAAHPQGADAQQALPVAARPVFPRLDVTPGPREEADLRLDGHRLGGGGVEWRGIRPTAAARERDSWDRNEQRADEGRSLACTTGHDLSSGAERGDPSWDSEPRQYPIGCPSMKNCALAGRRCLVGLSGSVPASAIRTRRGSSRGGLP